MSENPDQTFIGRSPAGPKDESEFLVRFATALHRCRTAGLDDKDLTYAVADVLDRANYIMESSVDLTVLAGREGTFVNAHGHDLRSSRPELADELQKGMPARGLAGVVVSVLDQAEVRAFLTAWSQAPSGTPAEALKRFEESLSAERASRGLPRGGPIELMALPASGKLPLPATALTAVKLALDDDDDAPVMPSSAPDDAERAGLAKLAQRAAAEKAAEPEGSAPPPSVPANRTMVKKSGDVIAEDLPKKRDPSASWLSKEDPSGSKLSWVAKGDSGKATSWVAEEAAEEEPAAEDEYQQALKQIGSEPAKAPPEPVVAAAPQRAAAPLAPEDEAAALAERDFLVRLGTAVTKRRALDERDPETAKLMADLAERASALVARAGKVTLLFGPEGAYVDAHRFDLARTHADVARELRDGAPARGLAGVSVAGPVEPNEVRALLSAWRVSPTGSPKASLARFREVLEGERLGYGLPDEGPIAVVPLPADGKLPLPEGVVDRTAAAQAAAARVPAPIDKPTPKPAPSRPTPQPPPSRPTPQPPVKPAGRPTPAPTARPQPIPEKRPEKPAEKAPAKPPAVAPAAPAAPAASREPGDGTIVGKKIAGPPEERELLIRLGVAFIKRKTHEESDREMSNAVADLLDRINFILEAANGFLTVLMGTAGLLVENRRYDLAKSRPDVVKELTEGAPQRMVAGFCFTGVVDQAEVKALLSAWKVSPTGSPKASFARLREVWDGERLGYGLPEDGPVQLLQLHADGKLPLPSGIIEVPDEADDEADPDVEAKASGTAVRPPTEVIGEDLEHRAGSSGVRRALDAARGAGTATEEEKSSTAVKKASPVASDGEEAFTAEELLDDASKTPVKVEKPSPANIEDLSPEGRKATLAYARLCSRIARAFTAAPADIDRALAAVRRGAVETLKGLEHTAFEDRIVAITAFPFEPKDARARHGANTAIFAALAGRSLGIGRVQLADLVVAAALHDDGDVEAQAKPDRWPRTLARALDVAGVSDLTILRSVIAYERAGPRAAVARPVPNQKRPRLESRIVACACAYDDAITGTPERPSARPDLALERLAPAGHDQTAARALMSGLGRYPRGTLVQLTNGIIGVVLAGGGRRGDKPRIRTFADGEGNPAAVREIELLQAKETIQKVEDPQRLGVDPRAHLVAWG